MKTSEISKKFCDYYQSRGYVFLSRSSLLHPSVPMSFVMSAGLVQIETALNSDTELNGDNFYLIQKCFRYFDVAQVGQDVSHLSLFEMPGAFSFTSSGKRAAIIQMWQVVTEVLGVDKTRLWVTFFAGGDVSDHSFDVDRETLNTWRQLGIPDERLIGLGPSDNYWKQGPGIDGQERYRKCGPNTEIFYDRGEQFKCSARCNPGCKCGRFIEFANSLFVGNESDEQTDALRVLSRPFTETVIGSERVAMLLQNKSSVFDIDSIVPVLDLIRAHCKTSCLDADGSLKSEYIIVDHLRALVHLVADGAPPAGKNGRQRLVKILIRETLTHAVLLNLEILNHLGDFIEKILSLSEISENGLQILEKAKKYFLHEARRFSNVQNRGQRTLEKYLSQNKGKTLSGNQIVILEKQYGFPSELSQLYLQKLGLPFSRSDYLCALQSWKTSLSTEL